MFNASDETAIIEFTPYLATLPDGKVVVVRWSQEGRPTNYSCVSGNWGYLSLVPTSSLRPYEDNVTITISRSVAQHLIKADGQWCVPGRMTKELAAACKEALGTDMQSEKAVPSIDSLGYAPGDWIRSPRSAEEFLVSSIEMNDEGVLTVFDRTRRRDQSGFGQPANTISNKLFQSHVNPPWVFTKVPTA